MYLAVGKLELSIIPSVMHKEHEHRLQTDGILHATV